MSLITFSKISPFSQSGFMQSNCSSKLFNIAKASPFEFNAKLAPSKDKLSIAPTLLTKIIGQLYFLANVENFLFLCVFELGREIDSS